MKLQYTCLLLGLLLTPLSLSLAHNITLDDAVGQVKEQNTGKILSARTEETNEHGKHHIIRVLTPEGRIVPITIDAQQHKHELEPELRPELRSELRPE